MEKSPQSFLSISECFESEMFEKRSRFIGRLLPIENAADLDDLLRQVRVDYPAATHYCWAYIIRGENGLLERYSDDGEPSGTAGMPILSVLKNSGLHNIIAIVIRYFGGTLLGTGGLVRAYTQAVQLPLEKAEIITNVFCQRIRISMEYNLYGFFERNLRPYLLAINDSEFTTVVTIDGWVPLENQEAFQNELMEASGGKAIMELMEQDFIPDPGKKS